MQFFKPDRITENIAVFDPHQHDGSQSRALPGDTVYLDDTNLVVGVRTRTLHRLPAVINLTDTRIIGKNKRGIQIWECIPLQTAYPHFYVASGLKDKLKSDYVDVELPSYYIYIEFTEWTEYQRCPHAIQLDIIGPTGLVASEERMLLLKYKLWTKGYPAGANPRATILTDSTKSTSTSTCGEGDIRSSVFGLDYRIFAVDPEGSTDYDDAFHFKTDRDGNTIEIGVHIADPTAYIKEGSPLDLEIRSRWTSLYLETKKINMIPDTYADDICSLRSRKQRPAISLIWKDNQSEPEIMLTMITVYRNMTYETADQFAEFKPLMDHMSVSNSHELVEKLMIRANHAVATRLIAAGWGLIRTMKPNCSAKYEFNPSEIHHDRLNLDGYCHFTSPIRRYPDMIVHRLLKTNVLHLAESSLTSSELSDMCEKINTYYLRVKKMYNELAILRLANLIDSPIKTTAIIERVELDRNIARLFLPEFKIKLDWKFCSMKAIHLLEIVRSDDRLILRLSGVEIDLTPKTELSVNLLTDTVTPFIKKKIRISL